MSNHFNMCSQIAVCNRVCNFCGVLERHRNCPRDIPRHEYTDCQHDSTDNQHSDLRRTIVTLKSLICCLCLATLLVGEHGQRLHPFVMERCEIGFQQERTVKVIACIDQCLDLGDDGQDRILRFSGRSECCLSWCARNHITESRFRFRILAKNQNQIFAFPLALRCIGRRRHFA